MDIITEFLGQKERLFKISKQTSWQLLGKGVTTISTFLIISIIARNFGEANTGILTLSLAYISFFTLLTDFGVNSHLMPKFMTGDITLEWRKLLGLRLGMALLATIFSAAFIFFWPSGQPLFKQISLLGVFAIFGSAVFISANIIFQAKLRYDLSTMAFALGTLSTLGFIFYLSGQNLGLPWVMAGYIIGWIITAFAALFLIKSFVGNVWPLFDLSYIKKTIKDSWPISLTLVINLVYFRLDSFIISYFRNFSEVGIYNLSYQIFQTILVIPTFIMNSFYPMAVNDYLENINKFKSNLIKISIVMFVMAFLGTILTLIFSPLVIAILSGGKGFIGSAQSLQMLSLGFPAFFVSSVLIWTMVIIRKYKQMMTIYLVGFIFNAMLNLLLVPKYSYIGASIVTVLSEYFILTLQLIILVPVLLQREEKINK